MIKKDVKVGDEVFFVPTKLQNIRYNKEKAHYIVEEVGRSYFYFDGGKKKVRRSGSTNLVYSNYNNVIGAVFDSEVAFSSNEETEKRFREFQKRIALVDNVPYHITNDKITQMISIMGFEWF